MASQHGYLLFAASLGGILLLILHLLQGQGTSEFSRSCGHLTLLLFQAVDLVLGQTVGLMRRVPEDEGDDDLEYHHHDNI